MKQHKTLFILFIVLNFLALNGQAQATQNQREAVFIRDRNGDQIFNKSNFATEGYAFYPHEYCSASIKIMGGKQYEKQKVRLGLIDNLVYYIADDSTELVVDMQVEKIEFLGCIEGTKGAGSVFQSGFAAVDKQTEKSFYQVLDSGKAKLLKYLLVTYSDDKSYNSASITRVFKTGEILYANLADNKMVKLSKNKESVINALADKKSQVEAFINSKGYKCKKEEEILMVFNYYNSL